MLISPCQEACPHPLHFHAEGRPPGFHSNRDPFPSPSHVSLHPQRDLFGGPAPQLDLKHQCEGWKRFCSAPPSGCSTLCFAGPQRFVENWQQKGAVRGPFGAEPKPAEPGPEQEHPSNQNKTVSRRHKGTIQNDTLKGKQAKNILERQLFFN